MKNREKILIAAFGVIVSFSILMYILINEMNFAYISSRIYSAELMKQLESRNYEKVYDNFMESYGNTVNQFIEQQNAINEILGDIKSSKFEKINNMIPLQKVKNTTLNLLNMY